MEVDRNNYQGLQIRPMNSSALPEYSTLLFQSFDNFKPSVAYLDWLYFKNPRGAACGYDAYDGGVLVAHYACIPIKIQGFQNDSLLSLNTATHPNYQGRGLFGELARRTYEAASSTFANVIGVANSKSVGGFVKRLGFTAIGNLELRAGCLSRQAEGSRVFSKEELRWRTECPGRPFQIFALGSGSSLITAKPFKLAPKLKAIVIEERTDLANSQSKKIGFTLDWRKGSSPILKLPKGLKPSPLVLIFKPLIEADSTVLTSFSFPDFDAF